MDISSNVIVDCAEVSLLNNSAFGEIFDPNPQFVMIFFPSR